jgi:hypothetical protein
VLRGVQGYPPLEAVGEAAAEVLRRFVRHPEFQPHPSTVEEHDSMASKFTPEIRATIIDGVEGESVCPICSEQNRDQSGHAQPLAAASSSTAT